MTAPPTQSSAFGISRASSSGPDEQDENNETPLSVAVWRRWVKRTWMLVRSLNKLDMARHSDGDQDAATQRRRQIATTALWTVILGVVCLHRMRRARILSRILVLIRNGISNHRRQLEEDPRRATDAPLSLLWSAAKAGQVQRALLLPSAVAFKLANNTNNNASWRKSTLPPHHPSLQKDLLEALSEGGCTDVSALSESVWSRLVAPTLAAALPFVYLIFLYRMISHMRGEDDAARTYEHNNNNKETTSIHTTFADVAGLDHVVTEVSEVVSYLEDPTAYHGLGARPPRAVLLYGPPGSGKTLVARAVAGEARCDAFVACSGSDFVDTFVGRGASRVRGLFDKARRQANRSFRGGCDATLSWWWWTTTTTPWTMTGLRSRGGGGRVPSAVIFIDEIDALARSRAVFSNNDERDQTLNQLLTEMDGFAEHPDVTVIVIAATNRADVLDPAILRRFDRQVHVGYPDAKGRKDILLIHARRIQCDMAGIQWDHLASSTNNFSGADLRNVVNDAALLAVRDKSTAVGDNHMNQAVERVRAMKSTAGRPLAPHVVLS